MTPFRLFLAGSAALACGVYAGLSISQVVPQPGPPLPIACAYNTSPPTLTSTQAGWVQCDSSGRFLVSVATGGGGAVTMASGAVASGAYSSGSIAVGAIVDGADVGLGPTTANAATAGSTGSANAKLRLMTSQLDTISTAVQGSIPLGVAHVGTVGVSPYPDGATPYTATATGTTGATTATLAASGGATTTYICGFSIRANATAAATGNATVTGTITGTLNFTQWTAPNASGLGIVEMIFGPNCVPASASNTAIAVVSAAPGAGGVVSVTAWGYKLP